MKLSNGLVWRSFIEVVNNGFLGTFTKLRLATVRVVMSVRPSTWNTSAPTRQIFTKFDIWGFFDNVRRKLKLAKITGTLHEDLLYICDIWSIYKVRELDIRGIVHYEFVPNWQTVNEVYYVEVLKRLREKVRRKRPELFANNSWILHHDNAPAHTALSVREFF